MPSIAASLDEYPDYNNKERTRIGTIAACAERLRALNPDSPHVIKRIEAYEWVIEALKEVDEEPDITLDLFYALRDRRNNLEGISDEEMDGYLGRELRSVDWAMEELVPGSGHILNRKVVVPWLVTHRSAPAGGMEAAVVLAENEAEAIELVVGSGSVSYPHTMLPRGVQVKAEGLQAVKINYRKGIIYHNNLY